jgi:hypothetical protein
VVVVVELDSFPMIDQLVDDRALADLRQEWLAEAQEHVERKRSSAASGGRRWPATEVRANLAELVQ